jgi:hypothetical protein
VALLAALLVAPSIAGANGAGKGALSGGLSRALTLLRAQGYLVPDQAAYQSLKAPGGHRAGGGTAAATRAPTNVVGWDGLSENDLAPSDSTGAIGPNSYVEAINIQLGIFNRSGGKVSSAGFETLTGTGHLDLSDPQVLWDTQTNRFYYLIWDTVDGTYRWGFSKTAAPTSVSNADWCSYTANFGYGSSIPDYPKLGQSSSFLIVGNNVFNSSGSYTGSDIDTIAKPQATGAVSSCPAGSGFALDRHPNVPDCTGGSAFTPEPAVQAGSSPTGWVTATPNRATASTLDVFQVTADASGHSQVSSPSCVGAGMTYQAPANAPQSGLLSMPLDTLDGRLTRAVAAPDPTLPGGGTQWALWTSHAIRGGAGSMERWYEIHVYTGTTPAPSLAQAGNVSDPSLYVFNGAVSGDWSASAGAFGADAVIGVTTSSSRTNPAVQMVSKVPGSAQSPLKLIKQSAGPDNGFDCTAAVGVPVCRWGDYSGASPDPAASATDTVGRVWLTNMNAANSTVFPNPMSAEWGTFNWEARP